MKAVLLALAGLALLSSAAYLVGSASSAPSTPRFEPEFTALLRSSELKGVSLADVAFRHRVYLDNKALIERVNAEQSSFTLGVGPYALLTFEEFSAKLGLRKLGAAEAFSASEELLGAGKDWRRILDVTPVRNMSTACNAGYAFASIGVVEAQVMRFRGSSKPLSAQHIIDCTNGVGNFGCKGGYANTALNFVQNNGVAVEAVYPYRAVEGVCQRPAVEAKIKGFFGIPNEALIMQQIELKPVLLGFEFGIELQHYRGGVYDRVAYCPGSNLNTYGVGVGYNYVNVNSNYWIIKYSLGPQWGEAGYLNLKFNTCGASRNALNAALAD